MTLFMGRPGKTTLAQEPAMTKSGEGVKMTPLEAFQETINFMAKMVTTISRREAETTYLTEDPTMTYLTETPV